MLRAVLGLGAALVMPATLSTITSTFPAERRTRAVSVWAGVAGGSAILGLLGSGVLLESGPGGRSSASTSCWPRSPWSPRCGSSPSRPTRRAAARPGRCALLPSSAWSPSSTRSSRRPPQGWPNARTLLGIAVGLAVLVVFVLFELRRSTRCSTRGCSPTAPRRRQPVDLRAVLRVLRLHLRRPAVPPARARRLGPRVGAEHAADGGRADAVGPAGAGPGGELGARASAAPGWC